MLGACARTNLARCRQLRVVIPVEASQQLDPVAEVVEWQLAEAQSVMALKVHRHEAWAPIPSDK